MHSDSGGGRPPPSSRPARTDAGGAPLVYFDAPVPTSWAVAGGPGSWDDTIRDALRYEQERQQLRSAFVREIRTWKPGTLVDLSVVADAAARTMLQRFVDLARREGVQPIQQCFKARGAITPNSPRRTARKLWCWPLQSEFSWALLLPNGQVALQVPPEEYSSIVPTGAATTLTVAGVNAPSPYGLTAEVVAEHIISWCNAHPLRW